MKKISKHPHDKSKQHDEVTSALLNELPFEDRMWIFWKNYNRHVLLVIAVVILGFLGYQGISFYKTSQIEKLQDEYRVALEQGKELAFAEANVKESLAGTLFISVADKFVVDGKYDEAIANYAKSLISLKSTPFGDRARLGIASANWSKGDQANSKKLLSELVNDNKAVGPIRAEAAYQLALISLSEKDFAESKEFLDTISRIPNAGVWAQKAFLLRDSTPGLSKA